MQLWMKALSAVALNYEILLSTPLKNCKTDEAVDGRSRSGVVRESLGRWCSWKSISLRSLQDPRPT